MTGTEERSHVRSGPGLPYARGGVDAVGYFVTCPVCGEKCRAEGGTGHDTVEDDVTKGAMRVYQLHFETAARQEASP